MAYTYRNAIDTTLEYLDITKNDIEIIDGTNDRGFVYKINKEKCVIFVSPIGCKQNNRQNWVDTRDSGRNERITTWNYALENDLKYFCLCVNSEQARYKDYFFSIENTEDFISSVSYRTKDGAEGTGTQANIPNAFEPHQKFERFTTDRGFNFAVVQKQFIKDYLTMFDSRSYLENRSPIEMVSTNTTDFDGFPVLSPRSNPKYSLNQILYGAPGTGKTYATAQYAVAILEDKDVKEVSAEPRANVMKRYNDFKNSGRIVFTTFHQNYGYEDFIQGIRPDTSSDDMKFREVDGVFKVIADRAMEDSEHSYVLIIDEINRANISKTFGELITLIEDDKRWGEFNALSIVLPSGEPFAVPNNLYIVGTMNSADKSISLIDAALRRRFKFVEFVPNKMLIDDENLRLVLERLNKSIEKELNSTDLLVGHSYFINRKEEDITDIMNHNIIPLLYEYFFDEKKKVEKTLSEALEGLDYEIDTHIMGRIQINKKDH